MQVAFSSVVIFNHVKFEVMTELFIGLIIVISGGISSVKFGGISKSTK